MRNTSMNIFGTTIEQLQNKSKNTLDIFTKTVLELSQINEEAKIQFEKREQKIAELANENAQLIKLQENNDKIISKIANILE